MAGAAEEQPNCMRCRHHLITHEVNFPYACQAMGFRSRQLPCRVVFGSSGLHCQLFELREVRAVRPGLGR
jgi:hypothetical protein